MGVSVPSNTRASQELGSNIESVTTPNIRTHYSSGDFSMNDLKMCLNEFINAEDSGISSVNNSKCDLVMEDECKDSDKSSDSLHDSTSSVEGLLFGEKEQEDDITSEANGCNKSVDQSVSPPKSSAAGIALAFFFEFLVFLLTLFCPVIMEKHWIQNFSQTTLKPPSAMKGSREKHGVLPKKLTVTWAPDVYDPIPTSVSHVPSKNQYRNNGRRYGKNKQKNGGKNSRGKGKDKDKKQGKKNSGGNTSKFKPLNDNNSFSEPETGIINYNAVSTDPFCGSSFLKESVQNLHFPVAEATR